MVVAVLVVVVITAAAAAKFERNLVPVTSHTDDRKTDILKAETGRRQRDEDKVVSPRTTAVGCLEW